MGHAKFTRHRIPYQHTTLEHVGYFGRWPRAREDLLINNTAEHHPAENKNTILAVFETFASNNRRKRALRGLAKVCHIAAINPWNDTAITFNSSDKPQF